MIGADDSGTAAEKQSEPHQLLLLSLLLLL